MPSAVDIANSALTKCGANLITSFSDNTEGARLVNANYDLVRDKVLRMHPWNCVTKRAQLAPLATDPAWGFDYAYAMPADALRIVEVDTSLQWRVEDGNILTDEGTVLNVRYIRAETDPNVFDSLLSDAIAVRLAMQIVERLTQSNSKKQLIMDEWKDIMRLAGRSDAQEGSSIPDDVTRDTWIQARRT